MSDSKVGVCFSAMNIQENTNENNERREVLLEQNLWKKNTEGFTGGGQQILQCLF